MKLKLLPFSIFFLLTLEGVCQNNSFTLKGTVTNDYSGYIYLGYGDKNDSSLIKDQKFLFQGTVDFPTESRLFVKDGFFLGDLYLENSLMEVNISIKENITYLNSITGNKTADLSSDLMGYFQEIQSDSNFVAKLYERFDTIISANPRNQFSGKILSDIILDPIFSYEQAYSLYNKLDTTSQRKSEIESIKASLEKLKNIKIGTHFKDFELPDREGKMINTNSLRQSLLLVEFWASWCGPCRKTNPELVAIYNTYNNKGFEVYGVSLDSKIDLWANAVKKDQLNWVNTIAMDGFKNKVLKELGIQYIPSNFLINSEGEILAINIKPVALEMKLIELLE